MKETLKGYFTNLPDPRMDRCKQHLLSDIVLLSIIASICGFESWESIEEFGYSKNDVLVNYLYLPNGIPSHDTIERVFKRLDPIAFEKCFLAFTSLLRPKEGCEIINVDGKTVCGSKDKSSGNYAIHLVSAWSSTNKLVLGQAKTDCKTNEVSAIKALLSLLDIENCVITADAMSANKTIVEQIITAKADYLIALKNNQKNLLEAVNYEFKTQVNIDTNEHIQKDHGRIETRRCEVIERLNEVEKNEQWKGLRRIVKITSTRVIDNVSSTEERFYISSLVADAKRFNELVRSHWGIENSLHWVLDVQFNEDNSRKRKDNAAQNFALVRKFALTKIMQNPLKRFGINNRRLIACCNNDYLTKILNS
jgi:predicted transposase YbfD/YdcC